MKEYFAGASIGFGIFALLCIAGTFGGMEVVIVFGLLSISSAILSK